MLAAFMAMVFASLSLAVLAQLSPPPLLDAAPSAAAGFSAPPLVDAPLIDGAAAPQMSEVTREFSSPGQEEASHTPLLGLGLNVGAPDGAGVSAYVRPWRWLELQGGLTHNFASVGLNGGVTFVPFDHWFAPTLSLELGEHPDGDANAAARFFTGNDGLNVAQLQNVGYSYQSALLGLELGDRANWMFFLRGGLTRVVGHATPNAYVNAGGGAGGGQSANVGAVDAELTLPAAKLGFAIFFL